MSTRTLSAKATKHLRYLHFIIAADQVQSTFSTSDENSLNLHFYGNTIPCFSFLAVERGHEALVKANKHCIKKRVVMQLQIL